VHSGWGDAVALEGGCFRDVAVFDVRAYRVLGAFDGVAEAASAAIRAESDFFRLQQTPEKKEVAG